MENNEVDVVAEVAGAAAPEAAPAPAPEVAATAAVAPEAAPAKRQLPDFGKRVGSAIIYAILTIGCILWGRMRLSWLIIIKKVRSKILLTLLVIV